MAYQLPRAPTAPEIYKLPNSKVFWEISGDDRRIYKCLKQAFAAHEDFNAVEGFLPKYISNMVEELRHLVLIQILGDLSQYANLQDKYPILQVDNVQPPVDWVCNKANIPLDVVLRYKTYIAAFQQHSKDLTIWEAHMKVEEVAEEVSSFLASVPKN